MPLAFWWISQSCIQVAITPRRGGQSFELPLLGYYTSATYVLHLYIFVILMIIIFIYIMFYLYCMCISCVYIYIHIISEWWRQQYTLGTIAPLYFTYSLWKTMNLRDVLDWKDCTLILTEGDSAKALAVAGLAMLGRDKYGEPASFVDCSHVNVSSCKCSNLPWLTSCITASQIVRLQRKNAKKLGNRSEQEFQLRSFHSGGSYWMSANWTRNPSQRIKKLFGLQLKHAETSLFSACRLNSVRDQWDQQFGLWGHEHCEDPGPFFRQEVI
jgi:hypothetical protein